MTNHDLCVKLINNMVKYGYSLFGETADHLADRFGNDVDLFTNWYNNFMRSR